MYILRWYAAAALRFPSLHTETQKKHIEDHFLLLFARAFAF